MIAEREQAAAIMARYKAKSQVKRQLAARGVKSATVSPHIERSYWNERGVG